MSISIEVFELWLTEALLELEEVLEDELEDVLELDCCWDWVWDWEDWVCD